MDTFYITSHSLAWNNLNGYLSNSGIDYLYSKETSGESIYNDIGIDDRKTLHAFDSHIKKLSSEKKTFAGVLHLNTNHFPFFVPGSSKKWDANEVKDMYDNSVFHFDVLMESMFKSLSESGTLDNTIILITSDHGESLLEHNYLGHIESYYLEAVSIPMMIYLPKSLQSESHMEKLYANMQKNVMNLDIIPTFTDLLLGANKNNFKTVDLGGKSLLGDISSNRTIVISNNNEISLYKVGISYIRNDMHYILKINSIPKKEELYNIKLDHLETRNLWSEQNTEKKVELRKELNGCSVCSEIFSNL
jgi:arylsulfatase A-like enzyme